MPSTPCFARRVSTKPAACSSICCGLRRGGIMRMCFSANDTPHTRSHRYDAAVMVMELPGLELAAIEQCRVERVFGHIDSEGEHAILRVRFDAQAQTDLVNAGSVRCAASDTLWSIGQAVMGGQIYSSGSKPQGGSSLLPFLPTVPGNDTQSGAVEVQGRNRRRRFRRRDCGEFDGDSAIEIAESSMAQSPSAVAPYVSVGGPEGPTRFCRSAGRCDRLS
jgi:hypothetical protein